MDPQPDDNQAEPQTTQTTPGKARFNPLKTVQGWVSPLFNQQSADDQALAPAPTNDQLAEQVEKLALDADTPVAQIVAMLAGQTADIEQVVQGFDESKEHPIGKVVNIVVTLLAYTLPWLIAAYAGTALGSTYAGRPFIWNNAMVAFYYIISWSYEFSLVGLMVAMVRQYKRVMGSNKRSLPTFVALIVLFLVLAITSSSAQWILFEHRINPHDQAQLIGALFRTVGTPLTDLASAVILAVLYTISLEQHLWTLQRKTDATIQINKKKIESRLEVISAALQVKNELQKEQDYQAKNTLANEIIGLFSENAVDTIRQSLEGRRQDTGSSYRRDGYR